jgi:Dolichyl-phosphate-mannose-protein mannosyltransferase
VSLPRIPAGVFMIGGLAVLALLLVADRYGYLGDEFYFVVTGRHLQLAAPDIPMLVPYLAAGWYALVGGHLWAFRILPALAAGGYVLLGGLVAREFGAPRSHQVAAAAAVAMTALTLAVGHLFETTTFDMLITAAALWMLVRALRAEPQRWAPWVAVGLIAGVAMEIKILAAPLLACCLLGVVVIGPIRRSPYGRSHFGHHAASPPPWCRELGFAGLPLGLSRRRWVHGRRDCEVMARDRPLDPWSFAACCCRGSVRRRQMLAEVTTMGSAQPYVDVVRRGHRGGHGGRDHPRGKRNRRTGAADLRTPRGGMGGCPCRMASPPPGRPQGDRTGRLGPGQRPQISAIGGVPVLTWLPFKSRASDEGGPRLG